MTPVGGEVGERCEGQSKEKRGSAKEGDVRMD